MEEGGGVGVRECGVLGYRVKFLLMGTFKRGTINFPSQEPLLPHRYPRQYQQAALDFFWFEVVFPVNFLFIFYLFICLYRNIWFSIKIELV